MKSPAGLLASSFLQAFNASIVLAIRNINGNDFFIIAGFYCLSNSISPKKLMLSSGLSSEPASAITMVYRSEEHTSELQSLMRISYAVFCLKKKKYQHNTNNIYQYL